MKRSRGYPVVFWILLCLNDGWNILYVGGCVSSGPVRENWSQTYNPENYGISRTDIEEHFNMHRGSWWNYYARGRWYLELGYPDVAAADFRNAILLRTTDKRGARSYGMHFWDYFPHRELGIALFRQGFYTDSIQELQKSLHAQDSARAKFYLNQAKTLHLEQTNADKKAPEIRLELQDDRILTNRRNYRIRGSVTDDHFVRYVTVADKDLFIELAQPHIEINQEVRFSPGQNQVSIIAEDLVGHRSNKEFFVTVDLISPVICINKISYLPGNTKKIAVELTVLENISLKEICIGDQTYSGGGLTYKFISHVQVTPENEKISISATDSAGNSTVINTSLSFLSRSSYNYSPNPRSPVSARPGYSFVSAELSGPRVDIGWKNNSSILVMEDKYFIDGKVYDPSGIKKILINGESLPISENKTTLVAFNHFISLQLGMNQIEVDVTNNANIHSTKTLNIKREADPVFESAVRYSIALMHLNKIRTKTDSEPLIYNKIKLALDKKPQRFRLIERDEQEIQRILDEQKLAPTAEKRTAIKVGKLISAEAMLFGDIEEGRDSITIDLRVVDTETGQILLATDVYGERKDAQSLTWLTEGLISKVKRAFPLVQGDVIDLEEGLAYINLGKDHALRQGMKLLFYREKQVGELRVKKLLKQHGKHIEARVGDLDKKASSAKFFDNKAFSVIKNGDKVITK